MEPRICLVDDDESICDALGALFRSRKAKLSTFTSPDRFLSIWLSSELREVPAAFILDVRMPGMSGLELFARMKEHRIPAHNVVIFLTGHGDVPLAVEAIKAGAYDFIEKPLSDNSLVDRVQESLRYASRVLEAEGAGRKSSSIHLTPRQREIAERIVVGATNRVIAAELGISIRTVEVHRAQLFERLGIHTAVELVSLIRPNGFKADC
jgi:two-component system response regulator DctR